MQMGTVQVSFVRSPCSLPCPGLSPVSVQWSSNKVHFCFVRPGPTSAVRLITLTGRFFQPGGKEHRFYYRKDREMSLMPRAGKGTHTVCPSGRSTYGTQRSCICFSWPWAPACLLVAIRSCPYVAESQIGRRITISRCHANVLWYKPD